MRAREQLLWPLPRSSFRFEYKFPPPQMGFWWVALRRPLCYGGIDRVRPDQSDEPPIVWPSYLIAGQRLGAAPHSFLTTQANMI